jgi:Zn-dependent alcohol dehydrogenase
MGANVTTPKIGDRVGIAWLHSSCGHCEHCLEGHESLCEGQQNSGYSVNGALAEYAIGTASHCIPIPDNVSDDQAAPLLCAGKNKHCLSEKNMDSFLILDKWENNLSFSNRCDYFQGSKRDWMQSG